MITKRIIPCLDVRNGRVVKGTNFEGIRDVADPVEMARMYNAAGADELVFYDITASFEGRALFTDILTRVAGEIFIPLTVGGGINTLEDFDRVLKCGADKVSVNSGALRDPGLIPAAAQKYGDQCVVLSADVKRVNGQFRVFAKGGREDTGRDALDWISWCVAHGAGEICLNSIDTDGVRTGFDLEMLDAVAARVNVPIIASGGAGKKEDFLELFHHKGIDAGLAAGLACCSISCLAESRSLMPCSCQRATVRFIAAQGLSLARQLSAQSRSSSGAMFMRVRHMSASSCCAAVGARFMPARASIMRASSRLASRSRLSAAMASGVTAPFARKVESTVSRYLKLGCAALVSSPRAKDITSSLMPHSSFHLT